MSSADPRSGRESRQYRPHPVSYVLAVVLPLLLVVALALPAAVVWGVNRMRPGISPGGVVPSSSTSSREGQPGVGDPYFPDYGSSGYDALQYTIVLSFDPGSGGISATTTMTARAAQELDSFYLDLALTTTGVTVDGIPADFEHQGFQDLKIVPRHPVAAGQTFSVAVTYSGIPAQIRRGRTSAWWSTGQEWTAAGEPESSAWWFPADDHPSDPATMDVSVRVPAGMEAISVGRLESRDSGHEAGFDTWHWVSREPVATYLSFVSIGQYDLDTGVVDGRPYVYAVSHQLSADDRVAAMAALRTSGAIVRKLEGMFGPYPFADVGGLVPAHELWFAGLETQTRPIYEYRSILNRRFAPHLLAHELAHMWYGDHVTLRQWNDMFNNEAYASWAQWGLDERSGGPSANSRLDDTYARTEHDAAFWQVTMIDPGKERLFATVYTRGPMALQALRNVLGDRAFFALARDWAAAGGSRSLEEWMIKAQSYTSRDLVPFFEAWIFSPTAPERTAANGFRS